MKHHVDLHAIVKREITVKEGHDIGHDLKDYLQLSTTGHVQIHIEPKD